LGNKELRDNNRKKYLDIVRDFESWVEEKCRVSGEANRCKLIGTAQACTEWPVRE